MKKIIIKIIDIIAILILIYWLFIKSYNMVFEENSFLDLINNINLLPQVLLIYIFMIFINMMELIFSFKGFVLLLYIGYRFINKRVSEKNMQHEKFDIEYFRDDLNKLSPSYVSYLIDFRINSENDIPAHILKLQLDGYIIEKNDKLVLTDKNQDTLKESDKLLLDTIKNNFEIFDL